MAGRELDIVVFGATGDTGIVACTLFYFKGKKLGISKWAPAARNLAKLQKDVLDRFKGRAPTEDGLGLTADPIQADAGDYASLLAMCKRTKCVVACAGPFSRFGESVVRACVEAGTHYVDITGETGWVEKMMQIYGQEATSKGLSMLSSSGYDSVPPDLTACLAAKHFEKQNDKLVRFELFCAPSGGAMPSGTVDTALDGIDASKRGLLRLFTCGLLGRAQKHAATERAENAPKRDFSISFVNPSEKANMGSSLNWSLIPGWSPLAGYFCLPHFMASINVVAVHRTAVQEGYGGLVYRERMSPARGCCSFCGFCPMMRGIAMGCTIIGMALLPGFCGFARKMRDYFNTPLQMQVRDRVFDGFSSTGVTKATGLGQSKAGKRVKVSLFSEYDAGLGFTMLSACTVAAHLVKENGKKTVKPGFETPTSAIGAETFADALRAQGVKIEVTPDESSLF